MIVENLYDVIIVGGSYSGLAAGMALGRSLRKVMIIDFGRPCNIQTPHSHNFLTNDGKSPAAISSVARQQVEMYSSVAFLSDQVTSAVKNEHGFLVTTREGRNFESKKLIFATGIKDVLPDIQGIGECWGISVLHCPYCHGYEVRHQKTAILANGGDAFEFCALISNWTNDLTLLTNGPATLTTGQMKTLAKHNILVKETTIESIEHYNGYLENITFKGGEKLALKALYARVSFVQHSGIPEQLGCVLTDEGYIQIDVQQKTSVAGVFACGDNTTRMRTVANAVSMGTAAGVMVNRELIEEEFI